MSSKIEFEMGYSQRNWNNSEDEKIQKSENIPQTDTELQQSYTEMPQLAARPQPENTYTLPPPMTTGAPRMLRQGNGGRGVSQSAFHRLKNLSTMEVPEKLPNLPAPGELGVSDYPKQKSKGSGQKADYPKNRDYTHTRCLCGWTTFFCVVVVAIAATTFVISIIYDGENCLVPRTCLTVVDLLLIFTISLEWVQAWLWREPSTHRNDSLLAGGTTANTVDAGLFLTPYSRQRLYDIPKLIGTVILIVLYCMMLVCTGLILGTVAECKSTELSSSSIGISMLIFAMIAMRLTMLCLKGLQIAIRQIRAPPRCEFDPLTSMGPKRPSAWIYNLTQATDFDGSLRIAQPLSAKFEKDLHT